MKAHLNLQVTIGIGFNAISISGGQETSISCIVFGMIWSLVFCTCRKVKSFRFTRLVGYPSRPRDDRLLSLPKNKKSRNTKDLPLAIIGFKVSF
jgi:hypothetical protein